MTTDKRDQSEKFHDLLKTKIDIYVHRVYKLARTFPKEELFGATIQLKRAALSVALNYVEGYARIRYKVYLNFLEISYGSLKESQYIIKFAHDEQWVDTTEFKDVFAMGDEISAMLWSTIKKMSTGK